MGEELEGGMEGGSKVVDDGPPYYLSFSKSAIWGEEAEEGENEALLSVNS